MMFPDSLIAKNFALGSTKAAYIISHGLAPYFKDKLTRSLSPASASAPCFVSCFDEAFNRIINTKQFDLHLIYFDEVNLQLKRVYLDSQFIGHGSGTDLLKTFKEIHHDVDYVKNLMQISMDGPNVVWKMLRLVKEDQKNKDPLSPELWD